MRFYSFALAVDIYKGHLGALGMRFICSIARSPAAVSLSVASELTFE